MGITVNNLNSTTTCLTAGVNNVIISYTGFVTATADNAVTIDVTSGDPNVIVLSFAPQSQTFPLAAGGPTMQLNVQLNVINSGGCNLNVTLTISFTTATGTTITRLFSFLY